MLPLKHKTVSGFKWQIFFQVSAGILSLVTLAVVSRRVDSALFGLYAMTFTVLEGLALFKAFGMEAGIVQRPAPNAVVISTAFWMTVFSGVACFVACGILAPAAEIFFGREDASAALMMLGIGLLLNGFGKIPSAILTREMKFKEIAVVQFCGSLVNAGCSVGFILISPTIVSLMAAYLLKTAVTSGLVWFLSRFRPAFIFDRRVAGGLLKFASTFVAASASALASDNVAAITAGRMLGTALAGTLSLAAAVTGFIHIHLGGILLRVLFPAYARIQKRPLELKRVFLKTIKFFSLLAIPFCAAAVILSNEFSSALYSGSHSTYVPVFQISAFAQLFATLTCVVWPVYMACCRPGHMLGLAFAGLLFKLPLVIVLTRIGGVEGAVFAELIVNALTAFAGMMMAARFIPFSFGDFTLALKPALVCTAWMSSAMLLFKMCVSTSHSASTAIPLLAVAGVGAIVYGAAVRFYDYPAFREFFEIMELWRGKREVSCSQERLKPTASAVF